MDDIILYYFVCVLDVYFILSYELTEGRKECILLSCVGQL